VAERIRYHLDEHVPPVVAAALRQHGIDVTTTVGAALRTRDDPAHLDFCRREQRVLVTRDADFLPRPIRRPPGHRLLPSSQPLAQGRD